MNEKSFEPMRCHTDPHDLALRWPGPDNTGLGTCNSVVDWATTSTCEACERDDVPLACEYADSMDRQRLPQA